MIHKITIDTVYRSPLSFALFRPILRLAIKMIFFAYFAFLAVKNFYRKGRKDLRKGRKEKCQVIAG